MSLKIKSLRGVFWTLIDTLLVRGLMIIAGFRLARILGPEEFGFIENRLPYLPCWTIKK